jgi:hypothetical protein
MTRNINSTVTPVTSTGIPILYKAPSAAGGSHPGVEKQDGSLVNPDTRKLERVRLIGREIVIDLIGAVPKGKTPSCFSKDEWATVQLALSLRNALDDEEDELELEHALSLLEKKPASSSRGGASQELLWDVVALQEINTILSSARLAYWWDSRTKREKLRLGIFCPDFKTAVIVSSLFGDTFRICPRCHKPFFTTATNKMYCSERCQGAHRVARHRFRNKLKKGGR